MKILSALAISLMTIFTASAMEVLHEKTVTLPVDISSTRIIMSNAGYGQIEVLKVIVPELADVTFLNHRNPTAGGPCLATYETSSVDDIIQNNPSVERVRFKISLSKSTYADTTNKKCYVTMTETVTGKIRGFEFNHTVNQTMPERKIEDCR